MRTKNGTRRGELTSRWARQKPARGRKIGVMASECGSGRLTFARLRWR